MKIYNIVLVLLSVVLIAGCKKETEIELANPTIKSEIVTDTIEFTPEMKVERYIFLKDLATKINENFLDKNKPVMVNQEPSDAEQSIDFYTRTNVIKSDEIFMLKGAAWNEQIIPYIKDVIDSESYRIVLNEDKVIGFGLIKNVLFKHESSNLSFTIETGLYKNDIAVLSIY